MRSEQRKALTRSKGLLADVHSAWLTSSVAAAGVFAPNSLMFGERNQMLLIVAGATLFSSSSCHRFPTGERPRATRGPSS